MEYNINNNDNNNMKAYEPNYINNFDRDNIMHDFNKMCVRQVGDIEPRHRSRSFRLAHEGAGGATSSVNEGAGGATGSANEGGRPEIMRDRDKIIRVCLVITSPYPSLHECAYISWVRFICDFSPRGCVELVRVMMIGFSLLAL